MRAIQIVEESGPDGALALVELPEPEPSHMLTPGEGSSSRSTAPVSRSPSCCSPAANIR